MINYTGETKMKEYHKINTIYKRDEHTKKILEGDYSIPEFEYLKNNLWSFSEKIDGTCIRIMYDGSHITFGGKTDNASIPAKLLNNLNSFFLPLEGKLKEIFKVEEGAPCSICLYGEGVGSGIQSGGNYSAVQKFVLFDIKIGEWWLQRKDAEDIANKLNLEIVPIIGTGTLDDAVALAKAGIVSTYGNFKAEGIVARPVVELFTRGGQRIITKIKCRDFKS